MSNIADIYIDLYERSLTQVASLLEKHIRNVLDCAERIDAVNARAKTPERFAAKALKVDDAGNLKYTDPLNQIEDQIGARINVLYLSDVEIVKSIVLEYFHPIELQSKRPDKDEEFGYFGEHFILRLPDDAIPEGLEGQVPRFFELQIKTLFQHAWSECHHDMGYKSPRPLTANERRQLAFSAAQSWGADQIFAQLSGSILESPVNDD